MATGSGCIHALVLRGAADVAISRLRHQNGFGDCGRTGTAQAAFGAAKSDALPAYCHSCEYLKLCWGECPKNRLIRSPEGEPGLNYLCSGLKRFYRKATAARPELAKRLGPV